MTVILEASALVMFRVFLSLLLNFRLAAALAALAHLVAARLSLLLHFVQLGALLWRQYAQEFCARALFGVMNLRAQGFGTVFRVRGCVAGFPLLAQLHQLLALRSYALGKAVEDGARLLSLRICQIQFAQSATHAEARAARASSSFAAAFLLLCAAITAALLRLLSEDGRAEDNCEAERERGQGQCFP
jgi:hypothetical protein